MSCLDKKVLKKSKRRKRKRPLFSDLMLAHFLKESSTCCLSQEIKHTLSSSSPTNSSNKYTKANFTIDQAHNLILSDARGLVFQQTYENTTKAIHVYPNGIWQDTFFPMAGS